jgi:hypothetical protein
LVLDYFSPMMVVLLLTCALSISAAHAQQTRNTDQRTPVRITDMVACRECTIEQHLIVSITDSNYPGGALVWGGLVHVNEDGSFLVVAGSQTRPELYVAARSGSIVRRVGRTGDGPGEYQLPYFVMEIPSAYLVADERSGRITHLSKADLSVARTTRAPGSFTGINPAAFSDGGAVIWSSVPTRENAGHAIHILDLDGSIRHSRGPAVQAETIPPRLAASGDTAFWVGYHDYRLELWSRGGELLARYQREGEWIRPRTEDRVPGARYTEVDGLFEDSNGRLWVHVTERQLDERGVGLVPGEGRSIVEVIDLKTQKVIVRSSHPGRFFAAGGNGFYLQSTRTLPSGEIVLDVWGYALTIGFVKADRVRRAHSHGSVIR